MMSQLKPKNSRTGNIRHGQTEIRLIYTVPEKPIGQQEDKSHRAKRLGLDAPHKLRVNSSFSSRTN